MQIVAGTDLFFIGLNALLLILAGLLVLFISGQAIFFFAMLPFLIFYLISALRRPLRRRRALSVPLPASWREFLAENSAYYRALDSDGKIMFERDVVLFLSDEPIVAIGGAAVDWKTRLRIASGLAVMLHGRPEWEPPLADGITVYPGLSFDLNYRVRTGNIAGQAPELGPLLIAEENLNRGAAAPDDGRNVLIHELAHFFDREMRKSGAGSLLRPQQANPAPWADFIAREWQKHLQHGSVLPTYADLNEAEFFAVACEMFFEKPWPLQAAHPELYGVLADFFNQDPSRVLPHR